MRAPAPQIYSRHEKNEAERMAKLNEEMSDRKKRADEQQASHKATLAQRKAQQMQDRMARKARQQELMLQQMAAEAARRQQVDQRLAEAFEKEEARKLAQTALTTNRRLATMQFSKLKEDYCLDAERAAIKFGPDPSSGKKQLEELKASLATVHSAREAAPGGEVEVG